MTAAVTIHTRQHTTTIKIENTCEVSNHGGVVQYEPRAPRDGSPRRGAITLLKLFLYSSIERGCVRGRNLIIMKKSKSARTTRRGTELARRANSLQDLTKHMSKDQERAAQDLYFAIKSSRPDDQDSSIAMTTK